MARIVSITVCWIVRNSPRDKSRDPVRESYLSRREAVAGMKHLGAGYKKPELRVGVYVNAETKGGAWPQGLRTFFADFENPRDAAALARSLCDLDGGKPPIFLHDTQHDR